VGAQCKAGLNRKDWRSSGKAGHWNIMIEALPAGGFRLPFVQRTRRAVEANGKQRVCKAAPENPTWPRRPGPSIDWVERGGKGRRPKRPFAVRRHGGGKKTPAGASIGPQRAHDYIISCPRTMHTGDGAVKSENSAALWRRAAGASGKLASPTDLSCPPTRARRRVRA